jgi:predicted nucleic acid-binding protein
VIAHRTGVFDLQIIATMLADGVQRIYTFNPGDFQVVAELTLVTPTWRAGTTGRTKKR